MILSMISMILSPNGYDHKSECTFLYNSSFFLLATSFVSERKHLLSAGPVLQGVFERGIFGDVSMLEFHLHSHVRYNCCIA